MLIFDLFQCLLKHVQSVVFSSQFEHALLGMGNFMFMVVPKVTFISNDCPVFCDEKMNFVMILVDFLHYRGGSFETRKKMVL